MIKREPPKGKGRTLSPAHPLPSVTPTPAGAGTATPSALEQEVREKEATLSVVCLRKEGRGLSSMSPLPSPEHTSRTGVAAPAPDC